MRKGLLATLLLLAAALPAAAAERVALLIGNSAYESPDLVLRNPANDVAALERSLDHLGFEVRRVTDLSRSQMLASLEWLRSAAQEAEIAMLFYAGHSIQVGAENLLIGVELDAVSASAVRASSVTLSEIGDALSATNAELSLIVLDACRDNPLPENDIGEIGLAPVQSGLGTLIAYSTDPGNQADDGTGRNSPFTAALLRHIETPGIDVRIMFGRVRQEVVRATNGIQIPWVEEAVIGEHYLAAAPAILFPDAEVRLWRQALAQDDRDGYIAYLEAYPEGLYARTAEIRLDQLVQTSAPGEVVPLGLDELPGATAALQLIGYVPRGVAEPAPDFVERAYTRWQATQPSGLGSFENLMRDAAQMATFLGTYTAGILRTDLQRFLSIEEALRIAEQNLAIAEADFGDDPAAQPTLRQMRDEVAEITVIRDEFAADLDASRTYYHELVVLTESHLADRITDDILPRFGASRDLSELPSRALEDAQTFHRHLELMAEAPEGSYRWLASMLEDL